MTLQWRAVLPALTGGTGPAILRARGHGERDPLRLAPLRTAVGKASPAVIATALPGPWRDAQGFSLTQALELFDFSTRQVAACETQIARQGAALPPRCVAAAAALPWPRGKPGSQSQHPPASKARPYLARLTGVARGAVPGLSASIAQTILAEVGTELTTFPTVTHCCAWRGLAPHNDMAGGRGLRSRPRTVVNRATQAFRQAAQAVARSDSACGAYFRALRARLGPPQAIGATAHKIARVVYHLLRHHAACTAESAAA